MSIYLILVFITIAALTVDHSNVFSADMEKRREHLLKFVFVLIFLVCVLRATSVGRDIPGYEMAYEMTQRAAFNDFNFIYFEAGYVLLMKICILFKLSFRWFFVIVYFIILAPKYIFIKKYSYSPLLSTLIYLCYMLFEFDLTGLRQAIAMSVSLLAFSELLDKRKGYVVKYVLFILVAACFHKSALLCLVFLPLTLIKNLKKYVLGILVGGAVCVGSRTYLMQYIKVLFSKGSMDAGASMYIGKNIIFLILLAIFILFIQFYHERWIGAYAESIEYSEFENEILLTKIYLICIVVALLFGSENAARSFMYFMQVVIVLLPNAISHLERKSILFMDTILVVFFIVFFYFNSLSGHGFDITPYKFFWTT